MLGRILRSGAYSNVLLGRLGDSADDRLVRRLVYGTIRRLRAVDAAIARASNRPLNRIEDVILDQLRIGAWELLYGDGAAHAAVNEAVSAATQVSGTNAGGFVNAVLRTIQRAGSVDAGESGVPRWIHDRLEQAWGGDEARAFLTASQQPAGRTARLRPGASGGRPVPGIDGAVEVDVLADDMVVMDPASVAVGLAIPIAPDMDVLDAAAAPGGKTLHLFDRLDGTGTLIASDRNPRRAASARRRLLGLGVNVPWIVADAAVAPFPDRTFDVVLLDAPCTGLGTLRGRPEIQHRLGPDDPAESGARQQHLLAEARRVARPGGTVIYAVCTVFPEETIDVVASLPASPPGGLPGRPYGKGWLLAPHLTGTDGMFISLIEP